MTTTERLGVATGSPVDVEFPRVANCRQRFARPVLEDPAESLREEFARVALPDLTGRRLAVGVGSRGISDLLTLVKTTIQELRARGAEPFVVPAMGSHGGGRAEAQEKILAEYGITAEKTGAPIRASMETVEVGTTSDGAMVHIDRLALESDGIVLINRIKPHTDFKGAVESGLMKMIAVGLGNREGADTFHSWTLEHGYERLIETKAAVFLETGKVLCGVAVIENAYHELARVEVIPGDQIAGRERELLAEAKKLMPSLPVDSLDILILDQIGKNISGAGMDPNVTGRWFRVNSIEQKEPRITRIVVLDLTPESAGNAIGIGLADFCAQRVVDKMDRDVTYLNAITSRNLTPAHIPLYFPTDREVLRRAMASLGGKTRPASVRLLRIRDTLSLSQFQASEALIPELRENPAVTDISELRDLRL